VGSIRDLSEGKASLLEPEHLVGRVETSALKLSERYISGRHAVFRWNGGRWQLRDLGSRNGTFVDGIRLGPGEDRPLSLGTKVSFGKRDGDQWEIVDDSPPVVMAVPLDGGDPVLVETDLLALPSKDDPLATIYRGADGAWFLEQPETSIAPIMNSQTFEVAGRAWRFCCAASVPTAPLSASARIGVHSAKLHFSVSRDEEHVTLRMESDGATVSMGARAHNYLLLTLARRRLADVARGLPEATCGWTYQDDLARDMATASTQLINLDVFRIRKQFAAAGVADAANVIERRSGTGQLRIGTGLLSISRE